MHRFVGYTRTPVYLGVILVAVKSKARICGCWLAGIVGSNSAESVNVLSLVSVVCCQVEVSETSRSLIRRSPTDCDVSLSVIKCCVSLYTCRSNKIIYSGVCVYIRFQ